MRKLYAVIGVLVAALVFAENSPAGLSLTATSANVAGAPDPIRIEIARWSNDEDRDRLMNAWSPKPESAAPAAGRGVIKGGGKGKGAPKGAETISPEAALAKALQAAPTVGYLWSSETAGYALRYAGKFPNADGSQRIILITSRRLGAVNQQWTPAEPPNSYEFSVIELRLNAKGEGEGKISLAGKIAPDASAKMVTLANYNESPVMLRNVRVRSAKP